ncbi:MAG TPA: hypothetical protein VFM65_11475 [Flavobacteriaceae bacterium]|nr:hypothetical protein [Flavobacteriaceae bacterium]
MEDQFLRFKKQREIGEVISDTFKFLRENYRLLFLVIFKIAGPALLVLILSAGYYMYVTLGSFDWLRSLETTPQSTTGFNIGGILIAAFLMLVSLVVYFSLLYGAVLNFIKSYIENNGEVNENEVRLGAKNDFWKLLGAGFLTGIMIFFGLLVCFFPGIYLMVPLSLVFAILVFDRMEVFDSISHSFSLIKNNWWVTFATLLVMWLLVYIAGIIFSIPAIVYSLIKAFSVAEEASMVNPAEIFDWVYILLNLISTVAQYLLYTVTVISTAFIYFNLNEQKNFTGTFETIENLGKQE